jgi:hypothetical protein
MIELPSADEPVDELQAQEQDIRDEYGSLTLSGRNAKVTH